MQKVKLNIVGLTYSQTQSGAYALVMAEANGERRLPIIIGGFEAQSIAIALEKDVKPPRPLTHDLFKDFADHFHVSLQEVVIHKLQDGVFYALLVCNKDGEVVELDARTSDAVALALRFRCPVYTYEDILKAAGIILDPDTKEGSEDTVEETYKAEEESSTPREDESRFSGLTEDQLEKLLDDAVGNEDYEKAAAIRDELDKRNQK
jgi:bifunctional DNase/RNase